MTQSETGLIALLEKQRSLKSLRIGQASVSSQLVQRLTAPPSEAKCWLCPQLVQLELPADLAAIQQAQMMVESRSAAGLRLDTLTLVGRVDPGWNLDVFSRNVGRLNVEVGEDDE